MLDKLKAAYRVLRAGSWTSALTFVLSVLYGSGVLASGQVTAVQHAAGALLELAAAGAAVVHGLHVRSLLNLKADAAKTVDAAKTEVDKVERLTTVVIPVATSAEPAPPATA
jgi:hypothetical protein